MNTRFELQVVSVQGHRRAVDRRERRAQLVRDRRHEVLPDLLEHAFLGDVTECVYRALVERDARHRDPALASRELEREGIGPRGHPLPARQDLFEPPADDALARAAGDRLGSAIPESHDPGVVDEEHAVADRLEHACRLRALLDLPVQLRVLDRRARAARELLGEREVVRPVAASRLGRHEGDDSEYAAVRAERDAHVTLEAEPAYEAEVEVVRRELRESFLADFRHQLTLAGVDDTWRPLLCVLALGVAAAELQRELDLPRIDMLDSDRAQPALLEDVDAGPVGNARHGELRHSGECAAVVE